jgi:hypothetical protein
MAKVQRNDPCPCGSGMKAKRCCHGSVKHIDVRIMPVELYRDLICELGGTTRIEFGALFEDLLALPELDLSLQVPLPAFRTPAIERAVTALHDEDGDDFDNALADVVAEIDNDLLRLFLARAVVVLRDAGRIGRKLAAVAVIELDREDSALFASSVAQSISVLAGERRTPTGLLVAASSNFGYCAGPSA